MRLAPPALLFLAAGCALGASASLAVAAPDYLREVKPILAAKCYACHGSGDQKGGLRLDTAEALRAGGDSGPSVIPGKGSESLLLQTVLGTAEDIKRMPLKKPPLADAEAQILKAWIDAGAPAPADERHWSFVPPQRFAPPVVQASDWARNPVDQFILQRLEEEGIAPAPEADRVTLLRRAKLDLLGLPPSPEEVDAFLADSAPDAYERAVDAFLASPHYGERWGRLWLDAARYADSNGYSIDAPRSMWHYRDWVIDALNRDLPFDQFTIEQLAGDLLPGATVAQKIATGFHRNTQINQEGGIDPEQFRIESTFDRVATTGTVWLGLTVACAQCHDHKFDPIAQKEYYQMFAFFNDCDEPTLELVDPAQAKDLERARAETKRVSKAVADLEKARSKELPGWEAGLTEEARRALRPAVRTALGAAPESRTPKQKAALLDLLLKDDADYQREKKALAALQKAMPKVETALVMAQAATPRTTHLFTKGDFTRPAEVVTPGALGVLPPLASAQPTRLELARWLVDPANPLTARVTVNRLWQAHFGVGLVETENDFGTQGIPPTHPQLLDWLATEFMAKGWSLKAMHRLMVTSATYRQSSRARPDLAVKDPTNKLLARQNRFRLDAELVRDASLAASGLLNLKVGGPSVHPPQPDGVMSLGQSKREWSPSAGQERYRRGLYTFFYRATPHPALTVFDAADGINSCTRRNRSNTPLQALTLLNDDAFFEMAQALSARLQREVPGGDDTARIERGFRLCVARPPKPAERARLQRLLQDERAAGASEADAHLALARVLLNLDETITRE